MTADRLSNGGRPVLPRLQLFEIHDLHWVPAAISQSMVEVLGNLMKWGRIVDAFVPALEAFVARAGSAELLELCSGSGQCARLLLDRLKEGTGAVPRIVLTDLRPHPRLWGALCASRRNEMTFIPRSVDATRVREEIGCGRPRLMVNAFHHFAPRLARAVLVDAHRNSDGIFIAENFGRNPLATLPCGFYGIPAAFANPVLTSEWRLAKALLTYVLPLIPLAVVWDGLVSSLRVYSREELLEMTRDLRDFEWHYGSFRYAPLGRGRYFYGVRTR